MLRWRLVDRDINVLLLLPRRDVPVEVRWMGGAAFVVKKEEFGDIAC